MLELPDFTYKVDRIVLFCVMVCTIAAWVTNIVDGSCVTTSVSSLVIVIGMGVSVRVEASKVTVDASRVSVVRMMLFSTIVTGAGVT